MTGRVVLFVIAGIAALTGIVEIVRGPAIDRAVGLRRSDGSPKWMPTRWLGVSFLVGGFVVFVVALIAYEP